MGVSGPPKVDDLSVSVEDLDAAATYIERLRQYVDDTIIPEMDRVKLRMQPDSDSAPVVPGGTPFGAFEDAKLQWKALTTSTANMEATIKQLSQKLAMLKTGTDDIAEAFRTVEERNHANGKEIERILDSVPPPPQAPGTYPTNPA